MKLVGVCHVSVLVFAALLTGCGDDSEQKTADSGAQTGDAVASQSTAGESSAPAEPTLIYIGAGNVWGQYLRVANAACGIVNEQTATNGLECYSIDNNGTADTLRDLRTGKNSDGQLNFGMVQSRSLAQASAAKDAYENASAIEDLRALFTLHEEPLTVVARADAGIKSIRDLEGKRVNLGLPGTAPREAFEELTAALGWDASTFTVSETPGHDQPGQLCDNAFDVAIYLDGTPIKAVTNTAYACDVVLVTIEGPEVDKLVEEMVYLEKMTIPAETYVNVSASVETIGVIATMISSTAVNEETVYEFVKAVFGNFDSFKEQLDVGGGRSDEAWGRLKKEIMIKEGLVIPLHAGAEKYFKEQGLM